MKGVSSIIARLGDGPGGRPPRPALLFIAACVAMVTLLMWIFLTQSDDWDLHVYQWDAQMAEKLSLRGMYTGNTVEYPPLALFVVIKTDELAQKLGDCSGLLGDTFDPDDDEPSFVKFQFFYRLEMALVVLGAFLLLWRMWKAHMAHEAWWEKMERFAVFCAGLGLLGTLAFDRLDSMMGAMMLVALALMRSRRHYLWSFLALAVAVAFKFVPVILAPLWVVGSLPVATLAAYRTAEGLRRIITAIMARGLQLGGMIVALFLPFFWIGGTGSLAFFAYHGKRGIEFESTYAALLGVLKYTTGLKISAPDSFGSHDIESSLSPMLTRLAPVIVLGMLAVAALLFVASMMRESEEAAAMPATAGEQAEQRVGRACGEEFTLYTILLLLVFIFANKVFSPQYLLWLVPLVPLMPLTRWRRMLFHASFLTMCLLTYYIYPTWVDDTLGAQLWAEGDHELCAGPTPLGVVLLAGRALVLAGMIGGLTVHLVRRLRAGGEILNHEAHEEHEEKITGEIEGLA